MKQIALVVALVIIGPAMYVFSRAHSLTMAFQRINVGDTPARVTAVLGKPQSSVNGNGGAVEYHYSSWPIPTVWVVRFTDGKVVEKLESASTHE